MEVHLLGSEVIGILIEDFHPYSVSEHQSPADAADVGPGS
jgi:hypothetical protein